MLTLNQVIATLIAVRDDPRNEVEGTDNVQVLTDSGMEMVEDIITDSSGVALIIQPPS